MPGQPGQVRLVAQLGLSQIIGWGTTYYLIGAVGDRIANDMGWSLALVHGGFTLALVVMGLSSGWAGRLIDRWGGRLTLGIGAALAAAGCGALAMARDLGLYYAAWAVMGVGMRLALYDAAFAALAQLGRPGTRAAMAQITLLGGLASTTFWPLGRMLADGIGWRGALGVYAALLLASIALHRVLPRGRLQPLPSLKPGMEPQLLVRRDLLWAAGLYVMLVTLSNIITSGLAAHLPSLLANLGLADAAAAWVGALVGIGQFAGRLAEVMFGRRVALTNVTLAACITMLPFFVLVLLAGGEPGPAILFALGYGAANGVLWIARGALPLMLFDRRSYGTVVGRLLAPGFVLSAAAPTVYAGAIAAGGPKAAIMLSIGLALAMSATALALRQRFVPREIAGVH